MGQKDLTGKNFVLYPDVYADTLNALAYAGREVVCAGNLVPAPTESFYYADRGKLTDQFSDAAMYEMRGDGIRILYILENEVQAKQGVILRKAGYEGALYRRQLGNEKAYPIVSLLLYWGSTPWNQPVSMKDLFRETNLDESTWKYITNGKLHVYAMTRLPKQVRNRFHSDMRIVVDYLAKRESYVPTAQKIVHPEALLLMLKALTNDNRYLEIMKDMTEEEKKGDITMCELLDRYENRGIQKGMQRGIQEGMQKGIEKGMQRGISEGESRFASLSEKLLSLNRIDDLRKAAGNKRFRNQLYKEFGVIQGS